MTQRCLKDNAGLADYSVTEGQPLDAPWVHPELRSRAGSFASPKSVYDYAQKIGSMSSIKRNVKKKSSASAGAPRFFLEIQPTLFRFSEEVWLVVHSLKML